MQVVNVSTLEALAARGYLVIAPDSGGSPVPSHAAFAADLVVAFRWARRFLPSADPTVAGVVGH